MTYKFVLPDGLEAVRPFASLVDALKFRTKFANDNGFAVTEVEMKRVD